MKHIDVAQLWLQDEVGSNRLVARRVSSEHIVADFCIKALSRAVIMKHAASLGPVRVSEEIAAEESRDEAALRGFGSLQDVSTNKRTD